MRGIKLVGIAALLAACVSTTFAADKLYDSVSFTGYGGFQFGQLVRGFYGGSAQSALSPSHLAAHLWDESVRSRFTASFYHGPSMKINFGLEYNYDFFTVNPTSAGANQQSIMPLTYFGELLIHRADMEYRIPALDAFGLKLQLGYFPFKYNPQATNLGEYLFRSECYPNFLVNEFYFPETRLLGANLEGRLKGTMAGMPSNVRANLLLTSATTYPTQDFSVAGLVNADLFDDAFELGGGVQAQRLLPVDPQRTTPHNTDNLIPDPASADSFYTFSGTKVMARTCFDVKRIGAMNFLNKYLGGEDLRLYGEWAVLGIKNYPGYYDNITERMPVMCGFDFPTFRLLDLLSLEAEYYTSPYFNDNWSQLYPKNNNPSPVPDILGQENDDPAQYGHGGVSTTHHRWKWSVFAKKSLGSNFSIVAQAARDHSRFQNPLYNQPYYTYNGDVTISGNDWYYQVRLMWSF